MGMTITEKILASHAGKSSVVPGDLINAKVDVALGNDITAPIAIKAFESTGAKKVFDKDRIMLVPDHFAPNKDIASAMQVRQMREFAQKYDITNYFEVGRMGVEHALLPEKGLVVPGDVIIGADSHTCTYGALGAFATGVGSTDLAAVMITGELWFKVPETIKVQIDGNLRKWVGGKDLILQLIGMIGVDGALYKALEFHGSTVDALTMDDRFSMANMAIEAGGKSGIFHVDSKTLDYINPVAKRKPVTVSSDKDAKYCQTVTIDAGKLEPVVAFPHLPSNTHPVSDAKDIRIDQVVVGSCTNGRLSDLRIAAQILKGRKVAKNVRMIIIPATQKIYKEAADEGLLDIFIDAEAAVSTPTCGPCLGGYMGILAEGEKAITTTNRNFVGRMGHPKSEVYLANPAVAAASAVTGKITHPEEVMA